LGSCMLKLLLFSDLHSNMNQCKNLVDLAGSENVDLVIGAGDFGSIRRGLDRVINVLKQITKPAVLVPGNSESDTELVEACKVWPSAIVLHGSGTKINQLDFWGIGGGIPVTPFGSWSFDLTETQAAEMLADCPLAALLVSHSPPKGAVDVSSDGRSLGSTTIREVIESKQPRLVVCGHIHACAGKVEKIGKTPVVNPGPQGMMWEMKE
jgi:Icc-related predicted phosphoesterase